MDSNGASQLVERLFSERDLKFREFNRKLLPSLPSDSIIGVRTPVLRKMAKEIPAADSPFLGSLPHRYFEENQIHAFKLSTIKEFDECIWHLEKFLPFVDNWATCDQLRPRCFTLPGNRKKLLTHVKKWIFGECGGKKCDNPYVVRFGIEMLMIHFLGENFKSSYLDWVARVKSEEYYVNMMIAWFFATALTLRYSESLPYIEGCKLPLWVHNKAIQKSIESLRLSPKQKSYLSSLKINQPGKV